MIEKSTRCALTNYTDFSPESESGRSAREMAGLCCDRVGQFMSCRCKLRGGDRWLCRLFVIAARPRLFAQYAGRDWFGM